MPLELLNQLFLLSPRCLGWFNSYNTKVNVELLSSETHNQRQVLRNSNYGPDTESRGLYGGNDDLDNSGTMTYASIRHGGTDIGAGNEINGLTLGGATATTVYIEV